MNVNLFSIPMPFNIQHIDELASINNEISKSRIATLYNGFPTSASNACGFEQERVIGNPVNEIEDMFPYIERTFNHDMDFIFLLNGVAIPSDKDFIENEEKLYKLISKLMAFGVKDFRIANTLIAEFISRNFKDAKLHASTSFEFHSIKQYDNLFEAYKQFVGAIPSFELNHNFPMLKNLKAKFPNIEWELMANEGCLAGCPFRNSHNMMKVTDKTARSFYYLYCRENCNRLYDKDLLNKAFLSNLIYPWQIEHYNEIGFYNFKLVGRNTAFFDDGRYIDIYRKYLRGVDDVNKILNDPIVIFSNYFTGDYKKYGILVKDVLPFLPDLQYFKDHGHLCASSCGASCKYCMDRAKQFKEQLSKSK